MPGPDNDGGTYFNAEDAEETCNNANYAWDGPESDSGSDGRAYGENGRDQGAVNSEPPSNFTLIDPTSLDGTPVPERRWIVRDWLPDGHVTLDYGDGGVGKTLLAQQLMTSCATGRAWCGLAVEQCRAVGLFCEDDEAELHRRQDAICLAYGLGFSDLADMRWASGIGADNLLVIFDLGGRARPTRRFAVLKEAALDFRARLVVIDTAADVYGGNENDRSQVRQFIGTVLNGLAQAIGGAVLLNAHPSRAGLSANGDMDGGSTSWSNSARSRWSLARPVAENGDTPDANARLLTRRKANYATTGDTIALRWQRGVLVPAREDGTWLDVTTSAAKCDDVFLQLLARCDAVNMPVQQSKHASNYAPAIFAKRPDREGFTKRDFEQAMNRLLAGGRLKLTNYGRNGDERRRLAATTNGTPGSDQEFRL